MKKNAKIFIAGHAGMVGSAIKRLLESLEYENLIFASRQECDLIDPATVKRYFDENRPEYVFLAAARVGGIKANQENPVEFLYENLMIQNNVILQSVRSGVKKLCFLGSSCIYPKECPQPMKEEFLMTGLLEPTNEGYALAKIAGLKLVQYCCKQYGFSGICPMPCNLYGPNDSFDLNKSHVLSALVKRFVDAVDNNLGEIVLWGRGIARREFMHVDDLAKALVFLMDNYNAPEIINVGWGTDVSIKELAEIIASKVGYKGKIVWDVTKPDGMLKKCLDVQKITQIGFSPTIALSDGIDGMIDEYNKRRRI